MTMKRFSVIELMAMQYGLKDRVVGPESYDIGPDSYTVRDKRSGKPMLTESGWRDLSSVPPPIKVAVLKYEQYCNNYVYALGSARRDGARAGLKPDFKAEKDTALVELKVLIREEIERTSQ